MNAMHTQVIMDGEGKEDEHERCTSNSKFRTKYSQHLLLSEQDEEKQHKNPLLANYTLYGTCEFDFLKYSIYSAAHTRGPSDSRDSKKASLVKPSRNFSSHFWQSNKTSSSKVKYNHNARNTQKNQQDKKHKKKLHVLPIATNHQHHHQHQYSNNHYSIPPQSIPHVEMQSLLNKDEKQELQMEENNLTWPRTKQPPAKQSTSAPGAQGSHALKVNFEDMHISPLASLFQPYRSNAFSQFTSDTEPRIRKRSKSADFTQFDDIDVQNHIDTFLSTLDKFEDEFDQQAYEELIPLNIRMALENQIFGWNHLYSATLGHVLMPIASYAFIYWIVTLIGLKGVGSECQPTYTWNCTLHKVYLFKEYQQDYQPIFKLSMFSFGFFRVALALWSAFSSFRTIRRRRKVWLHHQATEYFRNNTTAHLDMEQADRDTLLGKLRNRVNRRKKRLLNRRIMRKIEKAQGRFDRREKRRREFYDGSSEFEHDHHRRVQILSQRAGTIAKKKTDDENLDAFVDYDNAHEFHEHTNEHTNEDYAGPQLEPSDTDEFFVNYQLYKRTAKEEYERDHDGDTSPHFYGHTMPAFAMQSITQDQIRFNNGNIDNVAYAHGGFFGAAPFMLANPHWINILRQLMPDVYVEISRRVVRTPVPQLIHWAENNPVVAAYGTAHELEYSGKVPTLEWDVFLDPHLVQRVEVVLEARDSFLQGLAIQSRRIRTALSHKRPERRYTDKMENIATLLDSEDEKKILHFYNTEIDKRVLLLLEHILIAHGNLSQLALEQTGYLKRYNFSRVKHTRRTLGGGIYLKHWILTYTEALKMSTESDEDLLGDEDVSMCSNETPISSTPGSVHSSPTKEIRSSREGEGAPLLSTMVHEVRDDFSLKEQKTPNSILKNRIRLNSGSTYDQGQYKPSSPSSPKSRGLQSSTSFNDLAMAAVSSSSITDSMNALKKITDCDAPLGLILDLKSRHVPMRVWSLVLDAMRGMGARVEGIASFYQEDIRDMSKYCIAPVKEIMFFHSAGDLQKACHDGLIRRGDSVFFNAGSLFWNFPGRKSELCVSLLQNLCMLQFDAEECKKNYKFQPYARVLDTKSSCNDKKGNTKGEDDETECSSETNALMRSQSDDSEDDNCIKFTERRSSTIQQYKDHFEISIGLYVQEFAIDEKSMDLLVKFVNKYSNVYDLGFSWGGVNGVTVRGIEPGRFTSTDGLWNQRYAGERWHEHLYPHRLQ